MVVERFMVDLVQRLVPDDLWMLFRRVVLPTEVKRPQGGGRRRAGDRETLAAIYERKAEHFLAFVGIAAALIGHRRLAKR
ncbi:hypothetical protein [Streptomyces sp. NPDC058296]|uniref:hypothetical protein n=1 Tax=Streptomyces sp. NPDC058296 TaxID=3346432 RepID=UPI0036E248ED